MKIITRSVMDWDGNILEEESYDYEGPVASANPGIIAAGIGAAGSILGGNNDSTVQQKTEPWGPAQPYLKDILGEGERLYGQGTQFFPSQTFAPLNPWQLGGLSQNLNYSQALMPNQVGMAQGAWGSALNAPDVANNPYVQDQIQANTRLLNRNFQENIMPTIQGSATAAGQSGSSRHGVAEGIAARGTQEAIANQAANTMLSAYGQGLDARSQALGMSGNVLGLGMLPGQTMQGVGGTLNAEAQRYINEAMQRQQFDETGEWDLLSRYQNVVNPTAGLGGVTTAPNPYQQNPFASALGGGLLGYGAYNTLFGGGSSLGWTDPYGYGIG